MCTKKHVLVRKMFPGGLSMVLLQQDWQEGKYTDSPVSKLNFEGKFTLFMERSSWLAW